MEKSTFYLKVLLEDGSYAFLDEEAHSFDEAVQLAHARLPKLGFDDIVEITRAFNG